MRRHILGLCSLLVVLTIFSACHKLEEGAWFVDIDAAKKEAVRSKRNIMLLVSGDLDNADSDAWIETNIKRPEFEDVASLKYVLVNYRFLRGDFDVLNPNASQGTSESATDTSEASSDTGDSGEDAQGSGEVSTVAPPPSGAATLSPKALEKAQKLLRRKLSVMDDYKVQNIPCIYLLTSEGYYVADFAIDGDLTNKTYQDIIEKLTEYHESMDDMNAKLEDIRATQGLEKVTKIDALFKSVSEDYIHLMVDLMKQIVVTDKNNETELVGDYELKLTEIDVTRDLKAQDFDTASRKMVRIADKGHLSNSQKLLAYYLGGYFLTNSQTADAEAAVKLMEKAITFDPESQEAAVIKQNIEYLKLLKTQSEQGSATEDSDSSGGNAPSEASPSTEATTGEASPSQEATTGEATPTPDTGEKAVE